MPPHSSADVYAAAQEISTSLMHLRREQSAAKRHMHQLDDMIDEHQAKIDVLMHLVMQDIETTMHRTQKPVAGLPMSEFVSEQQPRVMVSPWPRTQSTSPPLIDQGRVLGADQQFVTATTSLFNANHSEEYLLVQETSSVKQEQPRNNDDVPNAFDIQASSTVNEPKTDQTTSTSTTVVPDDQGQTSTSRQRPKITRKFRVHGNQPSSENIACKKYSRQWRKIRKQQLLAAAGASETSERTNIDRADFLNAENARRLDSEGKMYYDCCCGRTFKHVYNFKRHVRTKHTFEKPFKCEHCMYASANKSNLVTHLRRFHKITW